MCFVCARLGLAEDFVVVRVQKERQVFQVCTFYTASLRNTSRAKMTKARHAVVIFKIDIPFVELKFCIRAPLTER